MNRHARTFGVCLCASLVLCLTLAGCKPGKTVKILPSPTITVTQPDDTDTPEPTQPATPTAPATATIAPTQAPATLTAVPTFSPNAAAKALVAAFENLAKAYPYRLTETTRAGTSLDRVTDYAAADRIHSSWVQDGKAYETITLGAQTWWKLKGAWEANPTDTHPPVDVYALIAPNLHDVSYLGQETVLGKPCFVFAYGLTIKTSDISEDGAGKAWVGIADNLPHQVDLAGTANGFPLTTHLVYSFGIAFDIQPPAP
jgi:hypothetical protein